MQKITNALISVFYKDGLEPLLKTLAEHGVNIYSTGGTQSFIESLGIKVHAVENLTNYPSILGGRVKTLHPKIFGGILARREEASDLSEINIYQIPLFDLVIVDLYPFEEAIQKTYDEATIIEKIDIGGISLIRAGAKNFKHTCIIADKADYEELNQILISQQGATNLAQRRLFAAKAFNTTSHYDSVIFNWFNQQHHIPSFKLSFTGGKKLRYGENPHQKGYYYGALNNILEQLHGKEISYNNLLDVDAAVSLVEDFSEPTVAIIKHNNPCGLASRDNINQAWQDALAGDPVSAFGGIICLNQPVNKTLAEAIDKIFLEVLIAPAYDAQALEILTSKKNRIILLKKGNLNQNTLIRSAANGLLVQDKNTVVLTKENLTLVTQTQATQAEIEDLLFADKIVKHAKSNAIVLAKNKQLIGIGCGQTSRVDALKQAIEKAKQFNFNLNGAVLSSDAFFPFTDCVEIANNHGIKVVVQPGGSIKDNESIHYCNNHKMAMYFTGIRHFKH
jgi:phosphoribosylaminoimidazolecarboxamide formyltransferase/IMP cyclohydrolase